MRQVILDTETTGLEPELGHRIIEIGCIELVNRRRTGRQFHRYLCPDREIDPARCRCTASPTEFLRGQPRFADVAAELREFIGDAELVIHNAAFDVAFLDEGVRRAPGDDRECALRDVCTVLDTLALARQMHPGQRNSLDALCKRYAVDNSQRDLHGALLDAELLLDVYLAMTGGQGALTSTTTHAAPATGRRGRAPRVRPACWSCVEPRRRELAAHERMLDRARQGERRHDRLARARAARRMTGDASRQVVPAQFPRPRAALVQADRRRFPGAESARCSGCSAPTVAGWAVLLEFIFTLGDGAALLPAAAGRAARDRGRRHRPHDAGERLRGSRRRRFR